MHVQLSTSQRITDRWDAEAAFVLGAGSLAGISLTLNRRFEKILLTARIEVCGSVLCRRTSEQLAVEALVLYDFAPHVCMSAQQVEGL